MQSSFIIMIMIMIMTSVKQSMTLTRGEPRGGVGVFLTISYTGKGGKQNKTKNLQGGRTVSNILTVV